MILYCPNCGWVWNYKGAADTRTSCPNCKGNIHIDRRRVDQPLPDGGDYSGAEWIGVSDADPATILYYDGVYNLVIEYLGEPDPFSRSEEHKVKPEKLIQWMMQYHWDVGFKHINSEVRDVGFIRLINRQEKPKDAKA